MKRIFFSLVPAALALLGVSLAVSAADTKPLPWEKNHLLIGKELYRANCVVCHDIDRPQAQSKKFGPSFYQLFRRDKMPLAAMKPNRDYIKIRIKFGGAIMPAFAKTLNDNEIDTLLDFLQSQ
jgi:mono/diheme cytochrome c family protein